eukprot:scaffold7312_cov97-Cylindrotheca_fusiformis.AAC.2
MERPNAMKERNLLMEENPLAATRQLDEFGMTPLHVLSLSQTPNLDMMGALIRGGHPDHIVQYMDSFGSTPMDDLCLNENPNLIRPLRVSRVLHAALKELGHHEQDAYFVSHYIAAIAL